MLSHESKAEFERHLAHRGLTLSSMTPVGALHAMVNFYRDVRADDCDAAADGDMLLFEWGTYDRGADPRFELDIARQFTLRGAEDEDVWQLRLAMRFAALDEFRRLGNGTRWCGSREDIDEFLSFVAGSAAFRSLATSSGGRTVLRYDCAG